MHLSRLVQRLVQRLCHTKILGSKTNSDVKHTKIVQSIFKSVFRYCMTHVVSAALKAPVSAWSDLELLELVVAMQQIESSSNLNGKLLKSWLFSLFLNQNLGCLRQTKYQSKHSQYVYGVNHPQL